MKRCAALSAIVRSIILLIFVCGSLPGFRACADDNPVAGAIPGSQLPTKPSEPKESIPPAPAGMIFDQAHVLQPEAAARLSARLVAARAQGVDVYVITLPSLRVPSSKQLERLDEVAKEYSEAWTPRNVGAVIIFDDEGGLMTVLLSPETDRRFASFAVEMELKAPLFEIQKTGLARDKLERSAQLIVETLKKFQTDATKSAHRQWIANAIMSIIALIGIGLAVLSAAARPKPVPPGDSDKPA